MNHVLFASLLFTVASSCAAERGEHRSLSESDMKQEIATVFHKADKDKNGSLDLSEFIAMIPSKIGPKEKIVLRDTQEKQFKKLDRNSNKILSLEEFSQDKIKTFSCLDSNHDGFVSDAEIDNNLRVCG